MPSLFCTLQCLHVPSVCLFALLNDCLSCFVSCFYCTTKPALYSSFCISFCLHAACVRLSVFAITVHAISVSVCSIPPVCTNRLFISYCCLLHHNACISVLVTLHLHYIRAFLSVCTHIPSRYTTLRLHTSSAPQSPRISFCLYAASACISLFVLLHIPSLCLLHLLPSVYLFALLNECFTSFCCLCTIIPVHLFSLHFTYTLN
jgi:hypothetical protein